MKKTENSSRVSPLFLLPVVMFPTVELPLHIFEHRYRAMIDDIWKSDGIFGIIRIEEGATSLAGIGCLAKLTAVTPLPDGRMNIEVRGVQRFTVIEAVDGKPYKQARVRVLDELEPDDQSYALTRELKKVLDDVARLSSKLNGHNASVLHDLPGDPIDLSYWIPSRLYGSPSEQQRILEMETVAERLKAEYSLLDELRRQLAARTAINDAFI